MRPGRFDRHIAIDRPDVNGRRGIFMVHLKRLRLCDTLPDVKRFAEKLAVLTPGFSGADVANVCNEAVLHAARIGNGSVTEDDFEAASEGIVQHVLEVTRTNGFTGRIYEAVLRTEGAKGCPTRCSMISLTRSELEGH